MALVGLPDDMQVETKSYQSHGFLCKTCQNWFCNEHWKTGVVEQKAHRCLRCKHCWNKQYGDSRQSEIQVFQ